MHRMLIICREFGYTNLSPVLSKLGPTRLLVFGVAIVHLRKKMAEFNDVARALTVVELRICAGVR